LVRFLERCGLDVGQLVPEFERSHAGLETPLNLPDTPYLCKDPWLHINCEDIDLENVAIDLLILPMRNLQDAAASRLLQERAWVIENKPDSFAVSENYGTVVAGAIHSLSQQDLERLLAVGFHNVVHWAVKNEIPLAILDFPRIINDEQYLIDGLSPWLQRFCTKEEALRAFRDVADPSLVANLPTEAGDSKTQAIQAQQLLLREFQGEIAELQSSTKQLHEELQKLQQSESLAHAQVVELRTHYSEMSSERQQLEVQIAQITSSRSWRLTAPLRMILRRR
jgi:hypothetical protein